MSTVQTNAEVQELLVLELRHRAKTQDEHTIAERIAALPASDRRFKRLAFGAGPVLDMLTGAELKTELRPFMPMF